MKKRQFKYFIIKYLIQTWSHHLFRLYISTIKVKYENVDMVSDLVAQGKKVILCTFHQQLFINTGEIPRFTKLSPHFPIIISSSRDGDIVADLGRKLGAAPIRGSSSQNGSRALKMMLSNMRKANIGVHVVDGPRGPMGVVKPGLIEIARASNAVMVPIYSKARSAWYFKSWDKFFIPKPFSKATFVCGAPIYLPEDRKLQREEFEDMRIRVEKQMQEEQKQLESKQ